jgi:cell division protein FtsW
MGRSTGDLQMTEMVHGPLPVEVRDPILPRWWRTVDRWTMASVLFLFIFGLILALAASPPLAQRNGLPAFHYVEPRAGIRLDLFLCNLLNSSSPPLWSLQPG